MPIKPYKTKEIPPDLEDYDGDLTKKKRPLKKKETLLNIPSGPPKTIRIT